MLLELLYDVLSKIMLNLLKIEALSKQNKIEALNKAFEAIQILKTKRSVVVLKNMELAVNFMLLFR